VKIEEKKSAVPPGGAQDDAEKGGLSRREGEN